MKKCPSSLKSCPTSLPTALKWCKGGVSCICIELSSPADHNEHLQQLTGDGQHGCARRVTELLVVYVCKEGYSRLT